MRNPSDFQHPQTLASHASGLARGRNPKRPTWRNTAAPDTTAVMGNAMKSASNWAKTQSRRGFCNPSTHPVLSQELLTTLSEFISNSPFIGHINLLNNLPKGGLPILEIGAKAFSNHPQAAILINQALQDGLEIRFVPDTD
ncbi:MAG: hypothetical protein KC474_07665 [Cyanobacteria bacterium HKST-UBA04]|nr:hypothetical protein [Cyanobacteria bacterium HKST-UBA04]